MSSDRFNPGLFYSALFLALATFPLIFIGGLVTSHGAGMAVPDWPNSYGYNMFLFPPSKWVGNIWYEHVHRLYASFVGLLSIVFCCFAWFDGRGPKMRWLGIAVLAGVVVQGVLGGLRVVLVKLDLAIVHGCFAQAFFCMAALSALVTSRFWSHLPDLSATKETHAGRMVTRLALVAVAVVYCQLIVGAVMRHEQAGLAIPDFPLTYGKVLPPISGQQLEEVNALRILKDPVGVPIVQDQKSFYAHWMSLWPKRYGGSGFAEVSMTQIWLAFGHRMGALAVSLTLLLLAYRIVRLYRGRPSLLVPALITLMLLLTQLTLGVLTVLLRKPADLASAHVATGALVLVTTTLLAAEAIRLYRPRSANAPRGFEPIADTPAAVPGGGSFPRLKPTT